MNNIPVSSDALTYNTFICDTVEKRKQLIIRHEYLDESCTCKFILKSCKINEPLYYYRQNPNGTMLSYMQNYDTIYQHMLVQLETFNYVKNNFNTNDYQYEMELYFLHSFCYETILFLNIRRLPITAELFRYMCSVNNMIIPDLLSNPYFGTSGTYQHKIIADYINEYNNGVDIDFIITELKQY